MKITRTYTIMGGGKDEDAYMLAQMNGT
jgi:hypothetical protein